MEIVSQQMGTKFIKGVKSEEKAKNAYLFMYFWLAVYKNGGHQHDKWYNSGTENIWE